MEFSIKVTKVGFDALAKGGIEQQDVASPPPPPRRLVRGAED